MRLQVGQRIDNNRVRLDFRNSPDKPKNTPSYEIEKSKADEFVRKYNAQEKKLLNFTMVTSSLLGGISAIIAIVKHSIKHAIIGIPLGILAGWLIGTTISSHKKNDLMDRYNVKEYSK
ncbi:hypothetical protein J6A64_04420 [bacterium]|nr:hypothetical protein [bacterium]